MSRPARGTAATWRNRIVGYEQVSVEAIQANPKNHRLHPEAQRRALTNSSRPGETVLDRFLGGAGTLVGAEATGRRCRGIDIEPKYIAVALERWATMTGGTPKLEPAS